MGDAVSGEAGEVFPIGAWGLQLDLRELLALPGDGEELRRIPGVVVGPEDVGRPTGDDEPGRFVKGLREPAQELGTAKAGSFRCGGQRCGTANEAVGLECDHGRWLSS